MVLESPLAASSGTCRARHGTRDGAEGTWWWWGCCCPWELGAGQLLALWHFPGTDQFIPTTGLGC